MGSKPLDGSTSLSPTPKDAVQEALALWEERERSRSELLAALDEAEADLQAGRYTDYTDESLLGLAEKLKHEARAQRKYEQP